MTAPPENAGRVPASEHYRQAASLARSCGVCAFYGAGMYGRCGRWDTHVEPGMVCDAWADSGIPVVEGQDGWHPNSLVAAAPRRHRRPAAHPAAAHNEILQRAYRHVDEVLEPRLARVIAPILAKAGETAARRFHTHATNFLTAAAASTPGDTGADITPGKAMVALYPRPDEAAALAEDGGEAPDVIHVTLCFLGEITPDQAAQVAEALAQVAAEHPPLTGEVGGVGAFADNGQGVPAIVLPSVPGLTELRQAVVSAINQVDDVDYSRQYGYVPHATIAYRPPGASRTPDRALIGLPLHFDQLHVVQGNQTVAAHPLTGHPAMTAAATPPPPDWAAPAPDEMVDVQALAAEILAKTEPVRKAFVQAVVTPTLQAAGLNFDVTNPFVQEALAQSAKQVTDIAETTRKNVQKAVAAGYQTGLSIPNTGKLIESALGKQAPVRATMIARTEMTRAANAGSVAATQIVADATGVAFAKEWLTAPGAHYPRHDLVEGLDHQTRSLNDPFDVDGEPLMYPGDPSGSPGNTINCRCTLIYRDPADTVEPSVDSGEEPAQAAVEETPVEEASAVEPISDQSDGLTFDTLTDDDSLDAFRNASYDDVKANWEEGPDKRDALYAIGRRGALNSALVIRDENGSVQAALGYHPHNAIRDLLQVDSVGATSPRVMAQGILQLARDNPEMRMAVRMGEQRGDALVKALGDLGHYEDGQVELETADLENLQLRGLPSVAPQAPPGIPQPAAAPPAPRPQPRYDAAIGITPFRADSDNPIGFYDTQKYQQFLADMNVAAQNYGVTVEQIEKVDGLWQGESEPSVRLQAHDHETGVHAFAADLGRGYNQDGVLLFDPLVGKKDGPVDLSITFKPGFDRQRMLAALAMQNIDGATVLADGSLNVIGSGSDFLERAQHVAALLDTEYDVEVGRMTLLERDGYDKAISRHTGLGDLQVMSHDPSLSLPKTLSLDSPGVEELSPGQHVNEVYLATTDTGEKFIVKPESGATQEMMRGNITPGQDIERERAAYIMSRYFEAVDPDFAIRTPAFREGTVTDQYGDQVRAGLSTFIPDATPAFDYPNVIASINEAGENELRNGALFDAVIGNTDRHWGNLMFDAQDRPVLIDHGLAFPETDAGYLANDQLVSAYDGQLYDQSDEYKSVLPQADIDFLSKLASHWSEIEPDLEATGLDRRAIKNLKGRLDAMISERKLIPERITERYGLDESDLNPE